MCIRGSQSEDPTGLENPFGYSGQFTDVETGLVYYGLRYYNPETGRFINRDPIGLAGGHNPYAFVGNNPMNAWDVRGMKLIDPDGDGMHIDPANPDLDPFYMGGDGGWSAFLRYIQYMPYSEYDDIPQAYAVGFPMYIPSGTGNSDNGNEDDDSDKCREAKAALSAAKAILSSKYNKYDSSHGWNSLNRKEVADLGLNYDMFSDPETGFSAHLRTNSSGQYLLSFDGTDFTSKAGLETDFYQNLGVESSHMTGYAFAPNIVNRGQYDQAAELSRRAYSILGDRLILAGNSLGAGLAIVGSSVTGAKVYAFNTASVNSETIRRVGGSVAKINASVYIHNGELLTHLRGSSSSYIDSSLNMRTIGTVVPSLGSKDPFMNFGYQLVEAVKRHEIDSIIEPLKEEVKKQCN
ncbi:MAG: RHS repeat-associated core domain-containing protein [Opitutales bacterium]|nr:RHS repeat-associated core domain-containing protein [Opitutales bacterium]